MKNAKDLFYLGHIIEAVDDISDYLDGLNYGDFVKDKKTQDAVFRKFEIIGEAAKNVSTGLRRRNGNVRWRDVIDMRNKLIHDYFGVDTKIVWDTAKEDLEDLKIWVNEIVKNLE